MNKMKNLIQTIFKGNEDKIKCRATGNISINNGNETYFSLLNLGSIPISMRKDTVLHIQYNAETNTYGYDIYEEIPTEKVKVGEK
jgi:hypothetical protein